MLRQAFNTNLRHVAQRRTFVSTVLLTRDWSTETHSALKREAKKRGLLQTGSKATLITRLQEYDREQSIQSPTPVPKHQQVRHASTTEAASAPSGSQAPPVSYPKEFLNVKIPSAYHPVPERPVAVPFVPDLWDSSKIKAESAPPEVEQPSNPKVLAVAGTETLIGGGPSHNLYPDTPAPSTSAQPAQKKGGFIGLINDLFPETANIALPGKQLPQELLEGIAETTQTSGSHEHHHSRTLDKDERNGVLALLGLLGGSWVLAGLFAPKSAYGKEHDDKSVSEKTAETL
ncbi:SAP domain-containing protein [Phanerochaete sordida]|uniref:SAP domain-containing protein n=1 Tax=Phanerochaete sordida TaxID=48140 RepID=A0A9P3G279_9APHY|nr:SAP domain-containing protein [Phanerochaete sordida]